VAAKREERLRFDYQKTLAARFGFADSEGTLAVEQMMQGFYRTAAVVLRINDRLLQRFEEQLEGEVAPEAIDDAFELRRGYLAARDEAWPMAGGQQADTAGIFDLFATWAAHPRIRGLHSRTARALAEALPSIPAYTEATPALRKRFMALLRGPQAVDTVARMARLGVLGRWLPAFASVDYVIVFGDPTVERLLRLLQPEVHCKGPDYTVDTVPERTVVREYGGRTVIIGDAKRHSTRDLVERLSRG